MSNAAQNMLYTAPLGFLWLFCLATAEWFDKNMDVPFVISGLNANTSALPWQMKCFKLSLYRLFITFLPQLNNLTYNEEIHLVFALEILQLPFPSYFL